MHGVIYSGWMLYNIQLEELLYDAERDLLAIAKFLVTLVSYLSVIIYVNCLSIVHCE